MQHRGCTEEDLLRTGQSRVFVLRRNGPGKAKAGVTVEYESGRLVRLHVGIVAAMSRDDLCITDTQVRLRHRRVRAAGPDGYDPRTTGARQRRAPRRG